MRPATLISTFAFALVAGCASAPPPAPASPYPTSGSTVTNSRSADFAAPPVEGDVQFVTDSNSKAKHAGDEQVDTTPPATKLSGDSPSETDVKSVHLKAAAH